MLNKITALPRAAQIQVTRNALAEIASGGVAERARHRAAAEILRTAQRTLAMAEVPAALPPVMAGWDAHAETALEYAETLPPAALDQLLAEGPRWAAALLRGAPELLRAA
ncbi:hypothetical protein ACFOD4_07280 [Pseudoroseomonas globiformis]|uniref:Uncharacterized protein n=1 Tax=Teichococcus globiformis TaxID=2307229 RepID=A0ABV7G2E4_9PROT